MSSDDRVLIAHHPDDVNKFVCLHLMGEQVPSDLLRTGRYETFDNPADAYLSGVLRNAEYGVGFTPGVIENIRVAFNDMRTLRSIITGSSNG